MKTTVFLSVASQLMTGPVGLSGSITRSLREVLRAANFFQEKTTSSASMGRLLRGALSSQSAFWRSFMMSFVGSGCSHFSAR